MVEDVEPQSSGEAEHRGRDFDGETETMGSCSADKGERLRTKKLGAWRKKKIEIMTSGLMKDM